MAIETENRKTVRKAIGQNLLSYENLIHRSFVTWCEILAIRFHYRDRDLITSDALLNYYMNQWTILVENRLLMEYGDYIKKNLPDTFEFYYKILNEYAEDLENYYPAALLPKKTIKPTAKYQFNLN